MKARQNLIKSKKYKITTELPLPSNINYTYPDNSKTGKLTDGVITQKHWREKLAVGWIKQGKISILFELDKAEKIAAIKCHAIGGGGGSVYFPREINVYTGNSLQNLKLNAVNLNHPEETGNNTVTGWLICDSSCVKPVKYVKIEITPAKSNSYTMIDEVEIFPAVDNAVTQKNACTSDLYDLYPRILKPVSNIKLGFVYFGATSEWPATRHMEKMREFGYNIVHSEVNTAAGGTGWRSLEPAQGKFNWKVLDKYITSAKEAGLQTPIMIGIEGRIPAWILEKYPDAAFINPYGEQVPGIVDFGHPKVLGELKYYLKSMAKRYRGCSNVIAYILGDEYSIYQNYYHKKNVYGQNFNPRMQKAFQAFLAEKYKNISIFNNYAQNKYQSFKVVNPQLKWLTEKGYEVEWTDWCEFREKEAARIYCEMAKSIKAEDKDAKVALSAISHTWQYNAETGINLGLYPWLDIYATKLIIKDNPNGLLLIPLYAKLFAGMGAGELWFSNFSFISKSQTNSPNCHVRGIFEAIGCGVKSLMYFMWDVRGGKKVWGNKVCHGPAFLYLNKQRSYQKSFELQVVNKLMPFFGKYGNILAKAESIQDKIGFLLPYSTYYKELKKSVTNESLAAKRYPHHPGINASYVRVKNTALKLLRKNFDIAGFSKTNINKQLAKYHVCSLIGNTCLSRKVLKQIQKYLASGGAIIADDNTAKLTENGTKRKTSLTELFGKYSKQIYITSGKNKLSENNLLRFLNKFIATPGIEISCGKDKIGSYLLRVNENGLRGVMVILINRASYGKTIREVNLKIDRNLVPFSPYFASEISPYPELKEMPAKIQSTPSKLNISVKNLKHVKVIFISNRNINNIHNKQLAMDLPRYKRYPWWNKKWHFRLPLTFFRFSGHNASLTLNMNKLMADRKFNEIPVLKSFRLVKQQAGKIGKPLKITIMKNREFNPFSNFLITLRFAPGKIDLTKPSSDFYLYFDSHSIDADNSYCNIGEDCWYSIQEKGIQIYGANLNTGTKAPVIYTRKGIIINKLDLISKQSHKLYIYVKNRYLKISRQKITVNNRIIERDFCNYSRLICLGKLMPQKDNSLKIFFEHFDLLQIKSIIIAPEKTKINTLIKSIPHSANHTDIIPGFVECQ